MNKTNISTRSDEYFRVFGRCGKSSDGLALFWSASGVEFAVKGSACFINLESDYNNFEQWIAVMINGYVISRQMLPKGKSRICLFRSMNPEETKLVRIIKEVQAMGDDEKAMLVLESVECEGTLEPVPSKDLRIEFIGDSITSGEGAVGAKKDMDWISMFFSPAFHYATRVAESLNADYRVISQSGWGTVCGWDNNIFSTLPSVYEKVCGPLKGERNLSFGSGEANDFNSWQPDYVVVNLGTNDCGALDQPLFVNPADGKSFKLSKSEDGSRLEEASKEIFETGVYSFLKMLRKNNPKAEIIWVYGMLGLFMTKYIKEAMEKYSSDTGDTNVTFLELTDTNDDTVGSRFHPGQKSHKNAADIITGYISKK